MSQKQLGETKKANRIFSKKELQEFSKSYMQLALEGIDAGALVSKSGKTSRLEGFDAVVLALEARSVNS